jgi:hypothetical protein
MTGRTQSHLSIEGNPSAAASTILAVGTPYDREMALEHAEHLASHLRKDVGFRTNEGDAKWSISTCPALGAECVLCARILHRFQYYDDGVGPICRRCTRRRMERAAA